MNRRSSSKPSNAVIEAILIVPLAVLMTVMAIRWDALDVLYRYSRSHESWELDEIILTVLFVGLFGFIFAIRRVLDLRREISRRTLAEHESAWLGSHDALTRLPNRHSLPKLLSEAQEKRGADDGPSQIVLSIDLIGFRKISDLVGQAGGDQLLIEVADRLRQGAKRELVVRHGADDFLIIADRRRVSDPYHFSSRLIRLLQKPICINDTHIDVSANIGYAVFPKDSSTLEGAVRRAEFAMNQARKTQRPIVAFDRSMEEILERRAALEHDLSQAVHNDEIEPHYQPIIELETGLLRGFEALARWNRKSEGATPPSIFIELAERMGLIVELSEKLLKKACRDARKWPGELKLSFNISAWQLADRLLGMRILKILSEAGFPPERLVIEVTESALIRDSNTAEAVLNDLHHAGVSLALDDFGTGYSSLFQLSRFPFDIIKIDRSFVEALEGDEKHARIIRAIVTLSNGIGIATTAEGVERFSQSVHLKDLGCTYGQGYLFGKPQPADRLDGYLENFRVENTAGATAWRFRA